MPRTTATNTTAIAAAMKLLGAAMGFAIGDTVKIVRSFDDDTAALCCNLDLDGDEKDLIGETYKITEVDHNKDGSFQVDHTWWFPWYCLELVHKSTAIELNDEYTADISTDGKTVTVGCQVIDASNVLELADRVRQVQASQPVKRAPARRRRRR